MSTTSDATGTYNRYAFNYGSTQFPDYPKVGVWPDGYYITYNIFNNGLTFAGSKLCAFDRAKMLVGAAATQQCFQLSSAFGGVLPSDLDGASPPPAGTPNLMLAFGSNSLNLWKFHVDWATPANTTLTGPTGIAVASFAPACNGGGTCIPQSSTTEKLDSLADRLMYRLAYRHFADGHGALVLNHSVTAGTSVGVRWYELRNATGSTMASTTPVVYQQGTYAPDATYRWMGSIAMDGSGDIAVGYSASSASLNPSIRYTGRAPGDPVGTMAAETILKTGTGSQLANLSRWGDYSAMTVDPVDDCTFWYTNEYMKSSGTFNWSTWISSFRFPACGGATQTLTSITVSPSSASVPTGGTKQFSATGLDQFGQPMNPQPTFTWAVNGGGSINSSGLFTAGATGGGPFAVTASSGTVSGTASVTVTSTPTLTTITVSPSSASVPTGGTRQFSATGLDQFGQPMNPQPTFGWSVSGGGSISSSGLFTAGATEGGPFTVTASSGTVIGTASVTVTSTPTDFSLAVSPSSQTAQRGTTASYLVTITPINGFSGPVTLTLSGQPAGVTVSFSSNPTTSGSSTLSLVLSPNGPRGTFTLTVTGTSGSLSHSATTSVTLTRR